MNKSLRNTLMVKLLVYALLVCTAAAAYALPAISLGDGSVNGTTVSFPLSIAGSQAASISSLQIDIKYETGMVFPLSPVFASSGSTLVSAGKSLEQSLLSDGVIRLVATGGTTIITDGVIARLDFNLIPGFNAALLPFSLSAAAADAVGNQISLAPRALGDVLGRGQALQLNDVVLILNSVVGAYHMNTDQRANVDMDNNSSIDVGDAILVLAKVTGI